MREQLGVDAALADPAGDQLRVLAAEVEHQDLLVGGRRRGDLDRLVDPRLDRQRRIARLRAARASRPAARTSSPAS